MTRMLRIQIDGAAWSAWVPTTGWEIPKAGPYSEGRPRLSAIQVQREDGEIEEVRVVTAGEER